MDNATFAERITALKNIATHLQAFAETILDETQRMESAQTRFAQRVSKRTKSGKPQTR